MRFKTTSIVFLLLLVIAAGCADRTVRKYTANVPVYLSKTEWRSQPVEIQSAKSILTPGRIYVYRNLLLVNEFMKGVHFFENSNPAAPVNLGFLPVMGNIDIAVRQDVMYLDSYTDLLAFNISDPSHPQLISRTEDVLSIDKIEHLAAMEGFNSNYPIGHVDFDKGIVIRWTQAEIETDELWQNEVTTMAPVGMDNFRGGNGSGKSANVASNGIAASTARFAIEDKYLYALNNWSIKTFDLSTGVSLLGTTNADMRGFPETVFTAEGNLFIGTTTGMLIYSLSNPSSPMFLSQYEHGNGCDPVVVQGDRAFVTLSSSRACPGFENVLDVIDISNLSSPQLLYSFNMTNPRGLGVDENTLFLCDGQEGLLVYDKTDLATLDQHLIEQFGGIVSNDVIAMGSVLIMTSAAGIYQYDYTDLRNIHSLSYIPVGQ